MHYRTLFVSDIHLGTPQCQVEYLELKTDGWLWKVAKVKKLTKKMLEANPLLGLH
jgi:hypothetical protein